MDVIIVVVNGYNNNNELLPEKRMENTDVMTEVARW